MRVEIARKVENNLSIIARSGKIMYGSTYVLWSLENIPDKVKAVVVSRNPPPNFLQRLNDIINKKGLKIPIIFSRRSNMELADLCGRPHPVSALSILDLGNAAIREEELYE